MEDTSKSRRAIIYSLERLDASGLIRKTPNFDTALKGRQKANSYELLFLEQRGNEGANRARGGGCKPCTGEGAPTCTGESASACTPINRNRELEEEKEKASSLRSEAKNDGAGAPVAGKGGQARPEQSADPKPTRLPADWQLPPDWADWVLSEFTATHAEIADAAASFRDYWCSKPGAQAKKLDWLATWRNWCRKEFRRKHRAAVEVAAAQPSADRLERQKWEGRMQIYAERGRWPRDTWGPAPGERGCQVPPDLLRANGVSVLVA